MKFLKLFFTLGLIGLAVLFMAAGPAAAAPPGQEPPDIPPQRFWLQLNPTAPMEALQPQLFSELARLQSEGVIIEFTPAPDAAVIPVLAAPAALERLQNLPGVVAVSDSPPPPAAESQPLNGPLARPDIGPPVGGLAAPPDPEVTLPQQFWLQLNPDAPMEALQPPLFGELARLQNEGVIINFTPAPDVAAIPLLAAPAARERLQNLPGVVAVSDSPPLPDTPTSLAASTPPDGLTIMNTGAITGIVTAEDTGLPLSGVQVCINDHGMGCYQQSGYTDATGAYTLTGLATGSYTVWFYGYPDYLSEYYHNQPSWDTATPVDVTAGQTTANINAALASSGNITGRITAEDTGLPLSGISVSASGTNGWDSTYTDATGAYTLTGLATGSYTVQFVVYYQDYLGEYYHNKTGETADPVAVTAGQTTPNINAALAVGGHITGVVTSEDTGLPLSGVQVCIDDEWGMGCYQQSGYTDATGAYTLTGLATGSYKVRFYGYPDYLSEYYHNQPSWDTATPVDVTAGQTTPNINAALAPVVPPTSTPTPTATPTEEPTVAPTEEPTVEPTVVPTEEPTIEPTTYPTPTSTPTVPANVGWITGRVTAESGGAALSDISVQACSTGGGGCNYASTAADGSYNLGGLAAGSYTVWFGNQDYVGEYYNNQPNSSTANPVTVTAGQTTPNINAALAAPGRITGRVTAEDTGLPLSGLYVYASGTDYGYSTYTDATGAYTLTGLAAGSYTIWFGGNQDYAGEYYNNKTWDTADPVAVTAGQTTPNINAALAPLGRITGRVTAEDTGLPLSGLYVSAEGSGWDYTRTDATGVYTFTGLAAGSYRVRFYGNQDYVREYYHNQTNWDTANPVTVTAGQTTPNINATLAVAGHITGRVTAEDTGLPLSDINVCAEDNDWNGNCANTTADGSYNIGGLAAGSYRVWFEDNQNQDYVSEYYNNQTNWEAANPVAVTAGQTTPNINAALTSAGHITGVVTGPGGAPLNNDIYVVAYRRTDGGWVWENSSWIGLTGQYDLGGLPAGIYRLRFSNYYGYTGDYASEYYQNVTTLAEATDIPVTTGATTPNINFSLALGGRITGAITAGGAPPIIENENIEVTAYRLNADGTWEDVVQDWPDIDGRYSLAGLPTGNYRLRFRDGAGRYMTEYYDNAAALSAATDVAVTAGNTTANINADLSEGGHITGVVTASGGVPLPGISVQAYRSLNGEWELVGSTRSEDDGSYNLGGLGSGAHRVGFFPDNAAAGLAALSNPYAYEYYNNAATLAQAADVAVTAGQTTANINAELSDHAAPVAQVSAASGSVTVNPQTGQLTIAQPSGQRSPVTITRAATCPGGGTPTAVTLKLGSRSYPMSAAGGGNYSAVIPASDLSNGAELSVEVNCGGSVTSATLGKITLYDPSGLITDAVSGQPVRGATVTLYKVPGWRAKVSPTDIANDTCQSNASKEAGSPWNQDAPTNLGVVAAPDSGEISPEANPLTTGNDGYYGWDVAAGCWYVVVSATGYETLTSPVVGVPTAVTDLDLALTRATRQEPVFLPVIIK